MNYKIVFSEQAKEDLVRLKMSEPKAFAKAGKLLQELMVHPQTGTGRPELLKGDETGQWSRRISLKHRLIYEIQNEEVKVYILSAYGHYEDK